MIHQASFQTKDLLEVPADFETEADVTRRYARSWAII
jgi:hypothetical protein